MQGTTPAAGTCTVTKISKMLSGWAESGIILYVGIILKLKYFDIQQLCNVPALPQLCPIIFNLQNYV